jgi:hypothetical protein
MKSPKEGMHLQSTMLRASMLPVVTIVAGSWSPASAPEAHQPCEMRPAATKL